MKTLAVDKYQRVRLPGVKGGDRLAFENHGNGHFTLKLLKMPGDKPGKVRLVKEDGYTVGVTDRVVTTEQVKEALSDFP